METTERYFQAKVGAFVSNGRTRFKFTTPVVRVKDADLIALLSASTDAVEIDREKAIELLPNFKKEIEFEEKEAAKKEVKEEAKEEEVRKEGEEAEAAADGFAPDFKGADKKEESKKEAAKAPAAKNGK